VQDAAAALGELAVMITRARWNQAASVSLLRTLPVVCAERHVVGMITDGGFFRSDATDLIAASTLTRRQR
jgi:hypothetical protein